SGCDSTTVLTVQRVETLEGMIQSSEQLCEGASITLSVNETFVEYQWNTGRKTPTIKVNDPGTYEVTLTDNNGCMSMASMDVDAETTIQMAIDYTTPTNCLQADGILSVGVNVDDNTTLEYTIDNGTSWQGSPQFANLTSGTYTITSRRQGSTCIWESAPIDLNLPIDTGYTLIQKCASQIYTHSSGQMFEDQGIFIANSGKSSSGCDSLTRLEIIHLDSEFRDSIQMCEGSSIEYQLSTISRNGDYQIITANQFGCDSTILLHVAYYPTVSVEIEKTLCYGESYVLGGDEYPSSGVYEKSIAGSSGCDMRRSSAGARCRTGSATMR
ncbi:MAG: hypothetical protein AAF479_07065, partial [Pseudomonadota bacterium]